MPDSDLPRFTGAELAALFGDDVAALQRYRMLVALVREGRPVAEVARAFGVSRESLRRLRRAFAGGDLAVLRTQRRGGGHFARGSPLARALRDELAADPGAPAAQLWERVSARLAEQGMQAARSTFYRLLARLRDDDGSTGLLTITSLLREALNDLPEDPPLALGKSQLSELLLPDERDSLQRGRRLAVALRAAIERMHPGEAPTPDDPRWRHYRILAGEYLEGMERAELLQTLALSASTYSRAKRAAIERLRTLLPTAIDELPDVPIIAFPDPHTDLAALRDAAHDLAAMLSPSILRNLSAEERAEALAALAPAVQLIDSLRQG
ncbi:MAG: helix-turn-helix domain-containing protein [Roseiflexaceae bacterium]|nr:helix-turn-helix domain-containing protein [Roseiflexaceae bacterium]